MFSISLSPKFILAAAASLCFGVVGFAQDGQIPERRPLEDVRPDLVRQLGLSPEQVQQFKRLNQQHRPIMGEAQKKMREANRELDMAIYADEVSDELVYARVRAFQAAQAEVNLLRFRHELAIRKILTHEQLVRFRDMRRRFAESRQQNPRDSMGPPRDGNRLRRRGQPPRSVDNQKRPVT